MSVVSTVSLPSQPTVGFAEEIALAGNGYTAPHSQTNLQVILDADATGGQMTFTVNMDPRWSCLIAHASWQIGSLADGKNGNFRLQYGMSVFIGQRTDIALSFDSGTAANNMQTWTPPPQLLFNPGISDWIPNLVLKTDNTDTEDAQLFVCILNYKKDAGKRFPLGLLHMPLTRGTST